MGDDDMLAGINARARRKARRRALIAVATITPGVIVAVAFTVFFGWLVALGMGAAVSSGIAILLENKVPGVEDE